MSWWKRRRAVKRLERLLADCQAFKERLTRENADLLAELKKLGWTHETFESPVVWRPEMFVNLRTPESPKCVWCEYRAAYHVGGEAVDVAMRWVADDGKMFCSAACLEAFYGVMKGPDGLADA